MSDDDLREEIAALFRAFLSADLAARFLSLLHQKPARWAKIDPWRLWPEAGEILPGELKGDVATLLRTPPLSAYAEAEVTVLRCGHDQPALCRMALRQALSGEGSVFEGFISIVPGKLGLAINHDGELCLLGSRT